MYRGQVDLPEPHIHIWDTCKVVVLPYIKVYFAKLHVFSDISKEYFKVIDFEDAAVADFATLAGGKQLDVADVSHTK